MTLSLPKLPSASALWQSWRVYLLVFVGGALGGIALEYRIMRPTVVVETPAPAVRQADSSLELARQPDVHATPAQQIPKGATVERVVHVEVQPRAEVVQPVPLPKRDSAIGSVPTGTVASIPVPASPVLCPPVGVDLTLIKLKDGTQRVVASSRDGIVLDSLSIDKPVTPDVVPKVLVWDAGAVYGSVAQWGGYVGRQLGPAHVAIAGLPTKGKEPARAMLLVGLRFQDTARKLAVGWGTQQVGVGRCGDRAKVARDAHNVELRGSITLLRYVGYKNKKDQAAAARRHYERNTAKVKARARLHNAAQSGVLQALVREKKRAPCTDCGVSYPFYVMQFDHVSGTKFRAVANMIVTGFSIDRVLAEIAKCELVCANCHAVRTWARNQ